MPIYEYVCPRCQLKFEELRPFSQANETAICPHCQQSAERVLSTFACLTKNEMGTSVTIGGGNSCASCSATSCATCGF